jgi:uncharacterized membrane protein
LVSTIYFYVSPFKEAQPELLSRTSPNIYDILLPFFGGLVGAIAITRVEKAINTWCGDSNNSCLRSVQQDMV